MSEWSKDNSFGYVRQESAFLKQKVPLFLKCEVAVYESGQINSPQERVPMGSWVRVPLPLLHILFLQC